MVNYTTNYGLGFYYNPSMDVINIGGDGGISLLKWDALSDDEIEKYIIDTLTHEHIHRAIISITNNACCCCMFDLVSDYFRDVDIQIKINPKKEKSLHSYWAKKNGGLNYIKGYYKFKSLDVIKAVDRFNKREIGFWRNLYYDFLDLFVWW